MGGHASGPKGTAALDNNVPLHQITPSQVRVMDHKQTLERGHALLPGYPHCFPTDPESSKSKEQEQRRIGNELLETTDFFLQGTHPESQQSVLQAGSRPALVTGKCSLFP